MSAKKISLVPSLKDKMGLPSILTIFKLIKNAMELSLTQIHVPGYKPVKKKLKKKSINIFLTNFCHVEKKV